MNPYPKHLAEQILGIANHLIFLEKKTIFRHGQLRLHPSEIHLMLVIAESPQKNAGEMAKRLGVTIGAVSQTLSRLEKKGVLIKTRDPGRKNEVSARFTKIGKDALEGFALSRAAESAKFIAYMDNLSVEDKDVIARFLSCWDEYLRQLG